MANETLTLSAAGANLVKAFEGCLQPIGGGQFKPYVCPAGVLTIGWGHTNDNGRQFTKSSTWTQAECDAEFMADMSKFIAAVKRNVKVPLKQYQFDALVSFTYNCGEGNLQKSTLLRKVNMLDFQGASKEFIKWNKGGGVVLNGLTRRRNSEALLFCNVPDVDYDGRPDKVISQPVDPMPQRVDPPGTPKPPVSNSDKTVVVGAVVAAGASVSSYGPWVAGGVMAALAVCGFIYFKFVRK